MTKFCPNAQPKSGSEKTKRTRIRVACFSCRDKKLRCDGKLPCSTCTNKGSECLYRQQDGTDASQDGSTFASGQQQVSAEQAVPYIPGALATPSRSRDASSTSILPDATNTHTAQQHAAPQADQLIDTESWNFDWMMDMEMNDFSFFDWMPNEASIDLSPHMWGFEYNTSSFVPRNIPPTHPIEESHQIDRQSKALETLKEELSTVYERVHNDEPNIDTWLKQPFVPRTYDLELLNLFLNLFMEYVPATFKSFKNFAITEHTLPEQVLAMSAVGALFSNIESSWKIARTLYGDASRMMVANGSSSSKAVAEAGISLAQMHLAFEIFGFCSGHKRSNELTEAFHWHTIQTFSDGASSVSNFTTAAANRMQWYRLRGDLFVIECYRICLAQLPPVVRPDIARDYLAESQQSDSDPSPSHTASHTPFSSTASHNRSSKSPMIDHEDLHKIAAHLVLSWFSMGMWTETSKPFNPTLWRREVPELSLRRLQIDNRDSGDNAGILLFHMNICALHSPMELINSFAYSYAHLSDLSSSTIAVLRQWQKDEDCDISSWHAGEIRRLGRQRMSLGDDMPNEAPHDALCVFLAALVGWAADVVSPDRGPRAILALEEGIEGMRTYKVRVKTFLISILESLGQNTVEEYGSPGTST